ncbi:hypothetical protein KP509_39G046100 [Ceratopteris richardii]|uniref:Uncharacterized protein n=1 Tax=Ceratopteris richardii TaxID=49495 RepID=A0A8T2Q0X9_CERRI|nr:hypothetical protein KP509_39G046100 [Ceratopteris richardii]
MECDWLLPFQMLCYIRFFLMSKGLTSFHFRSGEYKYAHCNPSAFLIYQERFPPPLFLFHPAPSARPHNSTVLVSFRKGTSTGISDISITSFILEKCGSSFARDVRCCWLSLPVSDLTTSFRNRASISSWIFSIFVADA